MAADAGQHNTVQLWYAPQPVWAPSDCCAADEQARLGALRAQLGVLEQERTGEFEARMKGMQDLSAALQAEQQARLEAQLELNRHKKKVAGLEAELQQQRTAMNQVRRDSIKAGGNP